MPNSLRDCILQPVPKPGKDPSRNSDNYRPIALALTLSKVFELCLLNEYRASFTTSSLQFGFKRGFSADLCTGLIKNVIARYCNNGSTVHGCFLDASIDHSLLFRKLLQRHLSPVVVRILLSWYMNQRATVLWNGSLSHKFSISNGVRQGGVLSPILFTIYIDDLLIELEKQGIGCFWRHFFVGAVCYADDIALIAPSQSALRLMLRTCSEFASSHSLIFNSSKTQLIEFSCCPSSRCGLADFSFNGEKLRYSKTVKHLGHILSNDLSDNPDIIAVKQPMCRKANQMLTVFGSCDPHTKSKLMQSFCLSLYGSALWAASSSELHSLAVSFNNILRGLVQSPCGKINVIMTLGGRGSWPMTFTTALSAVFSFSCDYAFLWLNKSRHTSSSVKICIFVTAVSSTK